MAALLKLALENPTMRDKELAAPFDYGAPYARIYRSWLHKTGLTELRFPVKLTSMGEVVWQHDPKLESLTTQWLLHWELTADPTRTETWHFFVNEFMPSHSSFTKEELQMALMMKLRSHSEKHFGPESSMNPVIVRKLLECYTEEYALGALKMLGVNGNKYSSLVSDSDLGPWDSSSSLESAFVS